MIRAIEARIVIRQSCSMMHDLAKARLEQAFNEPQGTSFLKNMAEPACVNMLVRKMTITIIMILTKFIQETPNFYLQNSRAYKTRSYDQTLEKLLSGFCDATKESLFKAAVADKDDAITRTDFVKAIEVCVFLVYVYIYIYI